MRLLFFISIGVLFLYDLEANAQNLDFESFKGENVKVSTTERLRKPYFFIYDTTHRISIGTPSIDASVPENYLQQLFRAQKKKDIQSLKVDNKLYKAFNPFLKADKTDTFNTYIQPIHKLTLKFEGRNTVLIKFFYAIKGKESAPLLLELQEIEDKWVPTNNSSLQHLAYIIRVLKTEKFVELKSARKSDDSLMDEVIKKTRAEYNVLDVTLLSKLLQQYEREGKRKALQQLTDLD